MAKNGEKPVPDVLKAIDTSLIVRFQALERDRRVLGRRLDELEKSRESISAPVYERVRDDYRSRVAALAEEAAPLADEAESQQAALASLVERSRAAVEEAELEREEHEVRHRLGELDEGELAARLERTDGELAERRELLTAVEAVAGPLLAAADDGGAASAGPATAAAGAGEPAPAPEQQPAGGATDTVVEAAEPAEAPAPLEETVVPAAAAGPAAAVAAAPPEGVAKTTLLPSARLVATAGSVPEGTELALEPLTSIGRSSASGIRLDEVAVSRHHAEISLEEPGFVLRDLGSQNGTYVNDEAIEERVLEDGDRVFIGTSQFVFRLD